MVSDLLFELERSGAIIPAYYSSTLYSYCSIWYSTRSTRVLTYTTVGTVLELVLGTCTPVPGRHAQQRIIQVQ